jgi:hypothetical protein
MGTYLPRDDGLAIAVTRALHQGDLPTLDRLLAAHPELATTRIGAPGDSRTLAHVVTDWPGHFAGEAASIARLAAAGVDLDAGFGGRHSETPLHWAASSDDVVAIDALLDAGADIEAPGASLGGGSPLADATGFGNWAAARRLVERGATIRLRDAACLGMVDRLDDLLAATPRPDADDLTQSFWHACQGGQQATAEVLLSHGADPTWVGWDHLTPLDLAHRSGNLALVTWLVAHLDARP